MSGWVCSGLLLPADSLGMIERRDRESQRQRETEAEIETDRDNQRQRQLETEATRDNQKQRDKHLCSHIYTDCEGRSHTHNLTRVPY